ncbi:MAG: hypothetical protein ACXWXF_13060 [Aeromicrobium sp.]
MEWDLGIYGIGVLLAMSLAFGVIAQLIFWRSATHWMWLIATVAYFVGGLVISEWLFGWAIVEELQPNIDGLSFDEVLLGALVPGIIAVLATWYLTREANVTVA